MRAKDEGMVAGWIGRDGGEDSVENDKRLINQVKRSKLQPFSFARLAVCLKRAEAVVFFSCSRHAETRNPFQEKVLDSGVAAEACVCCVFRKKAEFLHRGSRWHLSSVLLLACCTSEGPHTRVKSCLLAAFNPPSPSKFPHQPQEHYCYFRT